MSGLVAALLTAGALGWGALALRLAGGALPWRERLAWSFALGIGIVGWIVFWLALAGLVTAPAVALTLAAGLPGLVLLGRPEPGGAPLGPWGWALLALVLAVMAGDLVEGLVPPTDADSLAYHYAIPRQILAEGHLIFVPRAADGAIPLLPQMTYLAALELGGERAMTLWCALSGWAGPLLAYAIGRRHLAPAWALAGAALVLTMPAMLYGAGAGQVEARMAAFATVAIIGVLDARRTGALGMAAVAGLAAGFVMGSKYPGLLLAGLCGLALLAGRRGVRQAAVFAATAAIAGLQWYGWNFANTGDPVFPMLYGLVPYHDGVPWNAAQQAAFHRWATQVEAPLPRGVLDIALYPLLATFAPPDSIDSGRTGLGLAPVLLAPFALLAGWRFRRHPVVRSWSVAALICLGFYLAWSLFGASQRVRHYLPLMPVVIIGALAAATRAGAMRPLAVGVAAMIALQAAGQALFVRDFAAHLLGGESRIAFIERKVGLAFAVTWANATLPPDARIVTDIRQWAYLFDRPLSAVTANQDAEIEVRDDSRDPALFWRQLRARGITHAMTRNGDPVGPDDPGAGLGWLVGRLIALGCAEPVTILHGPDSAASRTLDEGRARAIVAVSVLALRPQTCPFEGGHP